MPQANQEPAASVLQATDVIYGDQDTGTVDANGNVKGGMAYPFSYGEITYKTTVAFTGRVSEDGKLTASGTVVLDYSAGGVSGSLDYSLTLTGQIDDGGQFTGSFALDGHPYPASASKQ